MCGLCLSKCQPPDWDESFVLASLIARSWLISSHTACGEWDVLEALLCTVSGLERRLPGCVELLFSRWPCLYARDLSIVELPPSPPPPTPPHLVIPPLPVPAPTKSPCTVCLQARLALITLPVDIHTTFFSHLAIWGVYISRRKWEIFPPYSHL